MKIKLISANKLYILMLTTFICLSSLSSIAQGIGSPNVDGNAPTGEGGAVPFDDNMNLLFLVVGIAFAVMIMIKQSRKKGMAGK